LKHTEFAVYQGDAFLRMIRAGWKHIRCIKIEEYVVARMELHVGGKLKEQDESESKR
jgi:hypothetical protein